MKHLKMTGNLFKCFVLAGLLSACNNEQSITPTGTDEISVNDHNAKITPLTRLTKEGDVTIQYVKAGKFFGKISKLLAGPSGSFNYEYSYDDNNPQGVLMITKKQYQKSNGKLTNTSTYTVTNGFCTTSTGFDGSNYEYLYTPQGQLSQVKQSKNGLKVGSVNFSYDYNSATNSYRLHSLTELGAVDFDLTYTYTSIPDKYSFRNPVVVNATSSDHGNMDPHLPIFGKFSDVLVDVAVGKFLNGPVVLHNYAFTYVTDNDGLVISKTLAISSGNNPPASPQTSILKYSDAWQGI